VVLAGVFSYAPVQAMSRGGRDREVPVLVVTVASQLSIACRREVTIAANAEQPPDPHARMLPSSNDGAKADDLPEPSTRYGEWSPPVDGWAEACWQPRWKAPFAADCRLPSPAHPGLLLNFRGDVQHECS
jgi:hypothetical protein